MADLPTQSPETVEESGSRCSGNSGSKNGWAEVLKNIKAAKTSLSHVVGERSSDHHRGKKNLFI